MSTCPGSLHLCHVIYCVNTSPVTKQHILCKVCSKVVSTNVDDCDSSKELETVTL